jgi:hypothetical protein
MVGLVVVVRSEGPGMGSGVTTVTGALARTMGRAKAETTMIVVRNQASSLQGLLEEFSMCLLAIRVGRARGERR